MNFLNLSGKTFFITGVANKKSIAYFTAKTLIENGAHCIFSVQNQSQVDTVQKLFTDSVIIVCDAEKKEEINQLYEKINSHTTQLDGFLHSLAFANFSSGVMSFIETSREDFLQAAQISSFSLVEISQALRPLLTPEASIVTISISNTKATSYGYLGPIKAMLDATVPYLAKSFSEFSRIRVNAIGSGPLKTSASAGIPDYIDNYIYAEALTLRKEALKTQEVANTACFLLSNKSSGINATTMIVDAGMSANYFEQDVVKSFARNHLSKN